MNEQPRARRPFILALALLATFGVIPGATAQNTEEAPKAAPSPLTIEAIEVTPAKPDVDTLCQLKVRLRNHGERPISGLGFTVTVAGQPLTVYKNQLFYQLLPAGEVTEVALFNFWTTETGRPAPKDGKLPVVVSLTEATWIDLSTDKEGVEVWKILEPIPGLPVDKNLPISLPGKAPTATPATAPDNAPDIAPDAEGKPSGPPADPS